MATLTIVLPNKLTIGCVDDLNGFDRCLLIIKEKCDIEVLR